MRIAIATCVQLPEPDPDQELLLGALRDRGFAATLVAWDDPDQELASYDVCLVRSTWNYYERPDAFRTWISNAARVTRLLNPEPILAWNLDKVYLRELELRGTPVIPTVFFERGGDADLAGELARQGWSDIVVKPTISAGSFLTRRFRAGDLEDAGAYLGEHLADRSMMVQSYMHSVETIGERSLVWIDGEPTHVVRKEPRFADGDESVSAAMEPTDEERSIAARVLEPLTDDLLYARVDMVRDGDGRIVLSELELLEPSLFFLQHPPALERFVDAVAAGSGSRP